MNNIVLFMRGPDDGWLRMRFRDGAKINLAEFREKMRKILPEKVIPWLATVLERHGVMREVAQQRAKSALFGFEPGDIVSEVMSFGSPTPIEVVVASPDMADARHHAQRIKEQMEKIPDLRDVQLQQTLDYPTVEVKIDREKAGLSGVTTEQAGNAAIVATSSSRFIALNYWKNSATGFDYQVEVLVPTARMTSSEQVARLPINQVNSVVNLMVRDVADVVESTMPGEFDRVASQRYLSVTANVEGESMGTASRQVAQAIKAAGKPPRGVRVKMSGQLQPMHEMFRGAGHRFVDRRGRDLDSVDGLFRIPAIGDRFGLGRTLRAGRRGDHVVGHGHDAESGIVHGHDHVHRRIGVELRDARDLCRRALAQRQARHGSRQAGGLRAASSDLDDRLRDGRGHDSHVVGAGGGQPNASAARPRGDGRVDDVDPRHAVDRAGDFRIRGGQGHAAFDLGPPRRRRKSRITIRRRTRLTVPSFRRRRLKCDIALILLMLIAVGCGKAAPPHESSIKTEPVVRLVHTTVRDLERTIGQPSFIDSYEQTAIYAKLPAYVLEWNVDIGDPIKENQVLATLFIPELKEEVQVKTAQVEMDTALVRRRISWWTLPKAICGRPRRWLPRRRPTSASSRRWSYAGNRKSNASRCSSKKTSLTSRFSMSQPANCRPASPVAMRPWRPSTRPKRSEWPGRPIWKKPR